MIKNIIKGFQIGIGFILSLLILFGIVYAVGFHSANEILTGTFFGNYNFNGTVDINNIDITPAKTQTINFDNSMNVSEIQALIDSVPKYIPVDNIITFQFEDGTYILGDCLTFQGFYGEGYINIIGNTNEIDADSLHVSQQVILDFSNSNSHGINIYYNSVGILISNFRINLESSGSYQGINVFDNSRLVTINNNYFVGTDVTGGGILGWYSTIYTKNNYFNNLGIAITAYHIAEIISSSNDEYGIAPYRGYNARYGGEISKTYSPYINGTAVDAVNQGGEIRG